MAPTLRSRKTTANRKRLRLEMLESRCVLSGGSLVVNTLTDDITAGNHLFSLREAVEYANSTVGESETIEFLPQLRGTAVLEHGQLHIEDGVTIDGRSSSRIAISGGGESRVFRIDAGATVSLSGLTIRDGLEDGQDTEYPSAGGGILNLGDLTLDHVVVTGNRAVGNPDMSFHLNALTYVKGTGVGGGLANFGTLNVHFSSFIDNEARGADSTTGVIGDFLLGGPSFVGSSFGGGLENDGEATIDHSRFEGNVSRAGNSGIGDFAATALGGAITNGARLSVRHSSFADNQAIGGDNSLSALHNGHALGGAVSSGSLLPVIGLPGASLSIETSSFQSNLSQGGDHNQVLLPPELIAPVDGPNNGLGGGVLVLQGLVTMDDVQLTDNQAVGGDGGASNHGGLGVGGGLFLFNFIGGVTADIRNVQVRGNAAIGGDGDDVDPEGADGIGGGMAVGSLGALFGAPGDVTITNALVSGNRAQGGRGIAAGSGGDGIGGGIANVVGGAASISRSHVSDNQAVGGAGGGGGDAFGGGIYNATGAKLALARDIVMRNWAIGGDATGGGADGLGTGGGIDNEGDLEIDSLTRFLTRLNRADIDADLSGV